jgi:integrase
MPMNRILTARYVETVRATDVRQEIPDAGCLGLYLVIQPTGTKSWAVRYRRPDGKPAKLTIGSVRDHSLAAARAAAATALNRVANGVEPASRRQVSAATADDSLAHHAARFLALHVACNNRPSTAESIEGTFNAIILPAWRGRAVQDIRRREIRELIESATVERGPGSGERVLRVCSKFFNWLVSRDVIEGSPCYGIERPRRSKPRERVLSDSELTALLKAADTEHPADGVIWILALTGTRRGEAAGMAWPELDKDMRVWTIPGERTKNHRRHRVPLSTQAQQVIAARPQLNGSGYVFTFGKGPINDWDATKVRLSEKAGLEETGWRLHDLRRTVASGMQRLGTRSETIERSLNHISGIYRGVAGTYQRDPLEHEVRAALQCWGEYVEELVSGKSG